MLSEPNSFTESSKELSSLHKAVLVGKEQSTHLREPAYKTNSIFQVISDTLVTVPNGKMSFM